MDTAFIFAGAVQFFLLMDPFGNLPFFISILQGKSSSEYRRIVVRESLIALIFLLAALFAGRWFLGMLGLSVGMLRLSGGLILLIIGTKMALSSMSCETSGSGAERRPRREPFIVPLAVPLICGPGTLAMLMTFPRTGSLSGEISAVAAVLLAWLCQSLVLLSGKKTAELLGNKMLDALESLMGLLLASMAVGMLVTGIHEIYGVPAKL